MLHATFGRTYVEVSSSDRAQTGLIFCAKMKPGTLHFRRNLAYLHNNYEAQCIPPPRVEERPGCPFIHRWMAIDNYENHSFVQNCPSLHCAYAHAQRQDERPNRQLPSEETIIRSLFTHFFGKALQIHPWSRCWESIKINRSGMHLAGLFETANPDWSRPSVGDSSLPLADPNRVKAVNWSISPFPRRFSANVVCSTDRCSAHE